ncbi:MAG TPA: hypothetical protein VG388_05545 [Solirubrobacteraceae bacterium]|jgi:hypothetical protein|nr:hypothetical protein [Solirubrobacteraceae bacterium]
MADARRFEPDEFLIRPGTYYNPETEILVIVDDSPEIDAEALGLEDLEGADWVLVSDEVPVDEHARDELLERFQIRHRPDAIAAGTDDEDEIEPEELDAHELEPE